MSVLRPVGNHVPKHDAQSEYKVGNAAGELDHLGECDWADGMLRHLVDGLQRKIRAKGKNI